MANTYTLQLTMGTTTIDFINDSTYQLLDGTFNAPPPPSADKKTKTSLSGGERMLKRVYGNRTVTFSFKITGTTVAANIAAVNSVYRLLEAGASEKTVGGGIYSLGTDHAGGKEVGEDGLLLRAQMVTTVNEDRLTFRVVSGSLEVHDLYSVYGPEYTDGTNVIREVDVTLECEPYAMGAEVALTAQGDTVYGPQSDSSLYDRAKPMFVTISGAEVKGDAPAPTKIMETRNTGFATGYSGVIIARESGNGLLSTPSVPVFAGSSLNDMWVFGGKDTASIKEYVVQIDATGAPDTFKWSIDGGSTFPTTGVSIDGTAQKLGSNDVYVRFKATTGHTLAANWSFRNDQANITINTNNAAPSIPAPSGGIMGTFGVNVPYGFSGRYKLVFYVADSAAAGQTEYRIRTVYNLPGTSAYTSPGGSWTLANSLSVVHAGVLDLTSAANPISRYPGADTAVIVYLEARRVNPADTSALNIEYVLLVPVEARDSYFIYNIDSTITFIEDTNFTFCGYGDRPVIGFREKADYGRNAFMSLSGEYIGSPPVLEPGVNQELYVIPTFGSGVTKGIPTVAVMDLIVLRYRPRYLVVG